MFLAGGNSDIGLVRKTNEDSFCADEGLRLFAVADGMGGHAAGDIASAMAIDVLRGHIGKGASDSDTDPFIGTYDKNFSIEANMLASGIRFANRVIYQAAQENESLHTMGSTIAAVLGGRDKLGIAHVGDSRIYLIRGNVITQITDDHSVVAEQIKQGVLTREEAENSAARNVITRALGQEPAVEVDLSDLETSDGDRVLLCTDGLYTMVPDEHIRTLVLSTRNPEIACQKLVEAAKEGGGKDNIAVVIVCVYKSRWHAYVRKLQRWARR